MQLNIVIDDKLMQQARLISELPSEREIIEEALRIWITLKHQSQRPENPAKALLESDFIGCGEADPMLSVNYKLEFAKIMGEKYGDR
ncbi:MAG: type II toxin-antitoxin system VapB family antitoxin [Gammaproteobacteria bacterium]|nr:type II toxin-antitoxin system VapB family antitoxin [Gammaproteobacteria bacterium]